MMDFCEVGESIIGERKVLNFPLLRCGNLVCFYERKEGEGDGSKDRSDLED